MSLSLPSRRSVIKNSLAAAAAAGIPAWFNEHSMAFGQADQPKAANDKPGILLVGCGGRGTGVAQSAQYWGNIVALCDADKGHLDKGGKHFGVDNLYSDFRKAIADKKVDVVINGTPDHWHTLVNIHAMRQGKDVYSEKPLTLTVDESLKVMEVQAQTKRVLQTGSQQRSEKGFRLACELVRNGRIGKLQRVLSIVPAGLREGPFATKPVPAGLDWDLWQGQTPAVEYVPQRCHTYFRYWYEYSGGTMTDWGAHHNDIALWAIPEEDPITTIEGKTLIEPIPGGYTTAPQYQAVFTTASGLQLHTLSTTGNTIFGGNADPAKAPLPELEQNKLKHGVKFEGSDGWIFVTRGSIKASKDEIIKTPLPENALKLRVSNNHMGDFFDCVKSRELPICHAGVGGRTAMICHLANISIRVSRKMNWDAKANKFVGDDEANKMLAREMRKPWGYDAV